MLLAIWEAVTNAPVQRTLGAIFLQIAEYAAALTAVTGLLWWLVKPRVVQWAKNELLTPIQATHKSVTVNGGKSSPPTLLDKVHGVSEEQKALRDQVIELTGRVDQVIASQGAVAVHTATVAERVDHLAEQFAEHELSGQRYLGDVRVVLGKSGIELPPAQSGDPE